MRLMNIFERWNVIRENLGKTGSEGGVITRDEELPSIGRVTIEKTQNIQTGRIYFSVTVGIHDQLVHTAFFSSLDNAKEGADIAKLLIQVLSDS